MLPPAARGHSPGFPFLPTPLSLSSYTGSSRDVSGFSLWFQTFILRCLSGMRISPLVKCEFKPSLPEYWLHIFWFQVRGQVRTWQISSPSLCLTFLSSLQCVSKTFFFFPMPWASCVLSKNYFPNPRSKGFSPRFYSSNFIVVCFTFGSTMHCEWFSHTVLCTRQGLFHFHTGIPIIPMFQHHFWKEHLSPATYLGCLC